MDFPGQLLPRVLLRKFYLSENLTSTNLHHQLVSSATADSKTDAFNFLNQGAGKTVFEVFLKLYIGVLFVTLVCSLGNRPQVSVSTRAVSSHTF